jgi:integrase
VLSDDELRAIWQATAGNSFPFGPFVRLLLILGCRRGELAKMTRDETDLNAATWRLTGDRTKNEEPRILPLPRMAVDILTALPAFPSPYVFAAGTSHIKGYSDFKERLDKRLSITAWRLHDLRRTMRTHLSALPIEQHVREMMIGHAQRGITGVYDVHAYQAEQRKGFEQWAARLRSIVEPSEKVVRLRG